MAVAAGVARTAGRMGAAARLAGAAGVACAAGRLGLLGPGRIGAACARPRPGRPGRWQPGPLRCLR